MKSLLKFGRNHPISLAVLLILAIGFLAVAARQRGAAHPTYDLVFSIDYNTLPYSDARSADFVIRVKNHKANVMFTGEWRDSSGLPPMLLLCEAATGELSGIPITPPAFLANDGIPVFIRTPGIESLTLDESSTAPNGYSIPGVNFGKAYGVSDLAEHLIFANNNFSFLVDDLTFHLLFKNDSYVECLQKVAGNQAGLTVHFIGWVISRGYGMSVNGD